MAEGRYIGNGNKCGICLSFYTEPRILNCFHVFCTPCLETIVSEDSFVLCPLCRMELNIPKEGVSALQIYPISKEYQGDENTDACNTNICQLCTEENMGICKCTDCQVILCSFSQDYHGKLTSLKNNKIEPLKTSEDHDPKIAKSKSEVCSEHKNELSLFCKPCNDWICSRCCDESHRQHDVSTVEVMAREKRNILGPRIAALKAKRRIVENTAEKVKTRRGNYFKLCDTLKREIESHSISLKDIFCKTVDFLTQKNMTIIENTKKKDLKTMDNFLDELETDELSIGSLIKSTETLIKHYSDRQFVNEYLAIGKRLDEELKDHSKSMPTISNMKLEYGKVSDEKIEQMYGKIDHVKISGACTALVCQMPTPPLTNVPTVNKIGSFSISDQVLDIVPYANDTVLVRTPNSLNLYRSDGTLKSTLSCPNGVKKVLKKFRKEIWLWLGQTARKGNSSKEGYRVQYDSGIACCFLHNGNLLVYNQHDKMMHEITENSDENRKFSVDGWQFQVTDILMAETRNFNIALSHRGQNEVFIVKPDGKIINKHSLGEFFESFDCRGLVGDNYGNIITADDNGVIEILSQNGEFQRELLSGVEGVQHVSIDECGNLWIADTKNNLQIYTYM